ncbi:hypothetical protein EU537_12840 [Candidatus Thorarchaeota archaeon]|nr:MAG: hypothetical protein EU537_12840 [Candidatus Thorarchaeota archaeon]
MGIRNGISELSTVGSSIIMVLTTLFAPIVSACYGWGGSPEGYWIDLAIIAITWIYLPESGNSSPIYLGVRGYGLHLLNPMLLYRTFTLWILSLIFGFQVIRFRSGDAGKKSTLALGILSLIPPTVLGLMGYVPIIQAEVIAYSGPIPLQFIIGYILMRYSDHWEARTPFAEDEPTKWWEEEPAEPES